jgi:hypothetical protein
MWTNDDLSIEVDAVDGDVLLVVIGTPAGNLRLLGQVSQCGRTLCVNNAHVDGLSAGSLGRAGLNAIGRKLLEEADVDEIVIKGSTRSTGRRPGVVPRPIRFRRRSC